MDLAINVELFDKPGTARVERAFGPNQRGRVFFEGTYWPAKFYIPETLINAEVRSIVTVIGRQGLTLLVMPLAAAVCS